VLQIKAQRRQNAVRWYAWWARISIMRVPNRHMLAAMTLGDKGPINNIMPRIHQSIVLADAITASVGAGPKSQQDWWVIRPQSWAFCEPKGGEPRLGRPVGGSRVRRGPS
jgi:hypothetical protein